MGKDGFWTYWGDPFIMYVNVKSSYSTHETEKILYQLYFSYKVKMVAAYAKNKKVLFGGSRDPQSIRISFCY